MKNLRKNKKGFTLIEVIVVLVILAIIIALAVPSVMKYVDDANEAKYLAEARAVYIAAEAEITKDYAPDSELDEMTGLLGKVQTAVDGVTVTEIKAFRGTDTTIEADEVKNDTSTVKTKPSEIKAYKIIVSGKTVKIVKNGTAEIVKP